jgi:hypothetical protein
MTGVENLTRREFLKTAAGSAVVQGLASSIGTCPSRANSIGGKGSEVMAVTPRSGPPSVTRYGRWQKVFDPRPHVTRVEFTGPDGELETRLAFAHQPAKPTYNDQGFEAVQPQGEPVTAVGFTPVQVGRYRWRAMAGDEIVEKGQFRSDATHYPGYVEISSRDPRYFAYSNGEPYCAIGLNLCSPGGEPSALKTAPSSVASAREPGAGSYGAHSYRRRFEELSKNGGNFCRLWLSNACFNAQTEVAGELNLATFVPRPPSGAGRNAPAPRSSGTSR